ncbi:SGNH/GDSL hydrolase family protein [Nocardia sp. NPDC005366]|uniref:SGNH/GDSL hydrolase family protein n=1 Tax=Nocardia sp. NPDC005366 TaxID=3156878 RepID=UPI0033AF9225
MNIIEPTMIGRGENTDPLCLPTPWAVRLLSHSPWRRFAVVGDSLAEGIGDPVPGYRPLVWGDRIAEAFATTNTEFTYLNTGKMFATISEVMDNQLPAVRAFEPDLVHVICGANDVLRPGADPCVIEDQLERLFGEIRATGAQISTFTLSDTFGGRKKLAAVRDMLIELNDIIRRTAARHDAITVELWEHPARLRHDWLSADRMHPSMSGQAVIATELIYALSRHSVPAAVAS